MHVKRSHVIKLMTSIYYIYIAELPAMFSVVVVVLWVEEQVWKGGSHGFESQERWRGMWSYKSGKE